MSISKILLALPALLLVGLAAPACDDGDGTDRGSIVQPDDPTPNNQIPDEEPPRCEAACANMLGVCDGIDRDDREPMARCRTECADLLDDDEIECLGALTCGDAVGGCLR